MAKLSNIISQSETSRINTLGQTTGTSIARQPDVLSETIQYQLPLTVEEFDTGFGGVIPIFAPDQAEDCPGRTVTPLLIQGGMEVEDFFVITGISLVAFGEPKAFTINGGIMARPAVETPTPCFDGCPVAAPAAGDVTSQASLYWGGPTWQFLHNFMNAYRFRWLIKRYEFVNVLAGELGISNSGATFEGAGCSQVPAMPYIQQVNAAMASKDLPNIFIPQNSAGVDADCVGAPTADVVYGNIGLNGGWGRSFCLPTPLVFAPGMKLRASFERVENDCCYYEAMRKNAVISPDDTGLPDEILTAGTCEAASFTLPGGCFTIGVRMHGYSITDDCCFNMITGGNGLNFQAGSPAHAVLKGNAAINALIMRKTGGRGLAGVPEHVAANLKGLMEATGG